MIVCEWHFCGCPGGVKEVITDEGDDDNIELDWDWEKIPIMCHLVGGESEVA